MWPRRNGRKRLMQRFVLVPLVFYTYKLCCCVIFFLLLMSFLRGFVQGFFSRSSHAQQTQKPSAKTASSSTNAVSDDAAVARLISHIIPGKLWKCNQHRVLSSNVKYVAMAASVAPYGFTPPACRLYGVKPKSVLSERQPKEPDWWPSKFNLPRCFRVWTCDISRLNKCRRDLCQNITSRIG